MATTKRMYTSPQPGLLRWARDATGLQLETAAKKVGTTPEKLASWEEGESQPTIGQLRKMAHVYKRPIAIFYLPEPPSDPKPPKDYRRLPGTVSGVESPELRYEIRRALNRREFALEILQEEGEEPTTFELLGSRSETPEELGLRIRKALGVDLDRLSVWRKKEYDPFNGWRSAIENSGALVLQMTDVEVAEARGFSISEFPLPTVVVNIKDAPRARTFSLLHEVTHVVLRQGGLCDLDDTTSRSKTDLDLEWFCNAVAGAALVPRDSLLSSPVLFSHGESTVWSDNELQELAGMYGVSREVVLRRLLDLGRTDHEFYRARREQFLEEYEEARRRKKSGYAPPHQVALASAGPAFTALVVSAYAQGNITASDLSDYLGVRLKHLPRIEQQLMSQARSA